MQRGTAGVLLTRRCSGGPARASSDQEGEKPARIRGEKDDQGRPLADADTVAFLLEKKVWDTEEDLRHELFKANKTSRWPLGTVSPAWDFLVSVLEEPGAWAAVRRRPVLLARSADTLRKIWDDQPRDFGSAPEQAQRKAIKSPDLTLSPALLTMRLDGTFAEKRAVFSRAGFSDEAFIKMVTDHPELVSIPSDELVATINRLRPPRTRKRVPSANHLSSICQRLASTTRLRFCDSWDTM